MMAAYGELERFIKASKEFRKQQTPTAKNVKPEEDVKDELCSDLVRKTKTKLEAERDAVEEA